MITLHDRAILRDLARQVVDIADLPIQEERRGMWQRHHRLERVRPMILVFPEGSWRELLPEAAMTCEAEETRRIEWELRRRIYHHQHIHDDLPIEKRWWVRQRIQTTGWGLEAKHIASTQALGSWAFDPVIKALSDLAKLTYPQVQYDPKGSEQDLEAMQALFGDLLDVRSVGVSHISFHLMSLYTGLRGLEQVMWDMFDEPAMLHDAMSILEEGHHRLVQQYVDRNLLALNNNETYHSSGGVGYTTELPQADFQGTVRPGDMWSSAEAQEMAQVSPEMHAEFILPYEKRLLAPFGLNGYGCCEDLAAKLDDVLTIPNLRRVSISPFADVDRCAAKLGKRAIFSWKPHPAHLVGAFSPEQIRSYVQHTIDVTRDCVVEMILKDTHTCENHPERFTAWTDIAQELVNL
jgi:hypothetical protein